MSYTKLTVRYTNSTNTNTWFDYVETSLKDAYIITLAQSSIEVVSQESVELEPPVFPSSGTSQGQERLIGTLIFVRENDTSNGILELDGRTITGGATTYPKLATKWPAWVDGNDIVLPTYTGEANYVIVDNEQVELVRAVIAN